MPFFWPQPLWPARPRLLARRLVSARQGSAAACVKASGLKDAKPAGQPMAYDDSVGMTALLVAGRYPQAHMKNRPGRVLCLFDRKKREAVVTEADQITLAPVAATGKAEK
jgi:hypothetical protein